MGSPDIQALIERQESDKRLLRSIGPKAPARNRSLKKPISGRLSKPQREAVRELVLAELRACYRDLQNKRREMPAWARGYDSALSAIEARITRIEGQK